MQKTEPVRVLFVNSEIYPYVPETRISHIGRYLPQGIQMRKKEIRSFMPRYGCINERRNQLHEVIRLSGMNIVINDVDRPLIIKVSSIPAAKMQVYFIDNEDYFQRKHIFRDGEGVFFEDNAERAVFFARGVLETVKKLRWKPDIIHCQGWISHILPLYLKKSYKDDPIFADTKVVLSLYNEITEETFPGGVTGCIEFPGVSEEDIALPEQPGGMDIAKLAIRYSDGVIIGSEDLPEELSDFCRTCGKETLPYVGTGNDDEEYIDAYDRFYDHILGKGNEDKH